MSNSNLSLRSYVGRRITCSGTIPKYVHDNPSMPLTPNPCEMRIPAHFEWNHTKMVPIRDQGMCTSCWAFSVSDMIADRLAIYTNGVFSKNLSVQYLLSCFTNHEGCSVGGSPEEVYEYIAQNGLPLDDVYPYEQYEKLPIGRCMTERLPPKEQRVFTRSGSERRLCSTYFSIGSKVHEDNIRNMQLEILLNGPIVGTLAVYDSLYQYQGAPNIYTQGNNGKYHGGHSCEILGWNCRRDLPTPYWIVRTPWGNDWPHTNSGGIVYVRFGVNECGIEARSSCAMVEIPDLYLSSGSTNNPASNSFFTYEE